MSLSGDQWGHWEIDSSQLTILEKIGAGQFGEVFKGRLWESDVVVKKLKRKVGTEENDSSSQVLEELKREISILRKLRHPNVVLYIGCCLTPPDVCIITEWCPRGSLHDLIYDDNAHITVQMVISFALGIAMGMNYLHSLPEPIIHRDLKPHNILVDQNSQVKIADFGLSYCRRALTDQNSSTTTPSSPRHDKSGTAEKTSFQQNSAFSSHARGTFPQQVTSSSQSGVTAATQQGGHYGIYGTPEWMAPEVWSGHTYTQTVDVYSYAITLCEILTRSRPLHDKVNVSNWMDVARAVVQLKVLPSIPEWCPKNLADLIRSCLSHDPSLRPSFQDIVSRLRCWFGSLSADRFMTQYEVPRLMMLLASKSQTNQRRAASEIALLHSANDECYRCGIRKARSPISKLETLHFLQLLRARLSASNTQVQLQSCRAIRAILCTRLTPQDHEERNVALRKQEDTKTEECSATEHYKIPPCSAMAQEHDSHLAWCRGVVCKEGGLRQLFSLLESPQVAIVREAQRVLLMLAGEFEKSSKDEVTVDGLFLGEPEPKPEDAHFDGYDIMCSSITPSTIEHFESLLSMHAQQAEKRIAAAQQELSYARTVIAKLGNARQKLVKDPSSRSKIEEHKANVQQKRKDRAKLSGDICTFVTSGQSYRSQIIFSCETCGLVGSKCCCAVCARICHRDHLLTNRRFSSAAFCDCGHLHPQGCLALSSEDSVKPNIETRSRRRPREDSLSTT